MPLEQQPPDKQSPWQGKVFYQQIQTAQMQELACLFHFPLRSDLGQTFPKTETKWISASGQTHLKNVFCLTVRLIHMYVELKYYKVSTRRSQHQINTNPPTQLKKIFPADLAAFL